MLEIKKGENISLLQIIPYLNEIIVSVRWFKKSDDETEFEIDNSAFLLTAQNKTRSNSDFIFYNQPNAPDNSVILKKQMFKISFNSIHPDINKISFILTLHNGTQKQQCFGMLEKIIVELFNFTDKQKLASYVLDDAKTETAIILAQLYRYNTEWKFKAIGQGYNNGLDVLARNYGVTVKSENHELQQNQYDTVNTKQDTPAVKNATQTKASINHKAKKSPSKKVKTQKSTIDTLKSRTPNNINPDFDIHNTDFMTKQEHYQPIVEWFKFKNFEAEVNENAMNTSGFFDEVAVELGDNYELLKVVSHTIKRRQVNKHTAYIRLENYTPQQVENLKRFCKHLYSYSFVAKYFYHSDKNEIVLHLQSATKIINFFNGEWLEWYAFMKIATLCHQQKIKFSCTRNMIAYLPEDDHRYEIDLFFLINDMPLFIECKSGEYRGFIDKYSKLRKKLFMNKAYFLMLLLDVDDEHLKGLTAMFDITFINEKKLIDYVTETLLK